MVLLPYDSLRSCWSAVFWFFLAYRFADFSLFIFTLILVGGLSLIFAFVKINGQSFHYFLLNIVQTLRRPSRRIWRKHYDKKDLEFLRTNVVEKPEEKRVAKVAKRGHIRDLALLVNTGGFYKPEDDL